MIPMVHVVYTDYVRGSNDEINILMERRGHVCVGVEYIDIRGKKLSKLFRLFHSKW